MAPTTAATQVITAPKNSFLPTKKLDLHKNAPPIHAQTHYGNTEALILDAYRDRSGNVRHFSTDPVAYADLLAGRGNPAWMKEKAKRVKRLTKMLEKKDYSHKHRADPIPAWVLFKDYLPFRKLYNERKGSTNISTVGRKTGFLDLPAELRNDIYRQWFVMDDAIELLPKSSGHTRRTVNDAYNSAVWWYSHLKVLKLLRLNRQINKEACSIFYGENEFRFTGEMGWVFLRGFMERIGKHSAACLRIISVHVFWPGVTTTISDAVEPEHTPRHTRLLREGHGESALQALGKCPTTPVAFRECLRMFEQYGTLNSLYLILPTVFQPSNIWDLGLDQSKFEKGPVGIHFIHLRSNTYLFGLDYPKPLYKITKVKQQQKIGKGRPRRAKKVTNEVVTQEDEEPSAQGWKMIGESKNRRAGKSDTKVIEEVVEEFEGPKAYAAAQGWDYLVASYDHKGRYTFHSINEEDEG